LNLKEEEEEKEINFENINRQTNNNKKILINATHYV